MLAIGYSLCHRVYYRVSRDAGGHHHLRHRYRRDLTPPVHSILDLKTTATEVCGLLPMGALHLRETIPRKICDHII